MQWHLHYEGPKFNADDTDLSQDPLVLCPVTTASNAVDFPLDPLGPHHSLALVQQPQSPPGFESVIHTVGFMIPGEEDQSSNKQCPASASGEII